MVGMYKYAGKTVSESEFKKKVYGSDSRAYKQAKKRESSRSKNSYTVTKKDGSVVERPLNEASTAKDVLVKEAPQPTGKPSKNTLIIGVQRQEGNVKVENLGAYLSEKQREEVIRLNAERGRLTSNVERTNDLNKGVTTQTLTLTGGTNSKRPTPTPQNPLGTAGSDEPAEPFNNLPLGEFGSNITQEINDPIDTSGFLKVEYPKREASTFTADENPQTSFNIAEQEIGRKLFTQTTDTLTPKEALLFAPVAIKTAGVAAKDFAVGFGTEAYNVIRVDRLFQSTATLTKELITGETTGRDIMDNLNTALVTEPAKFAGAITFDVLASTLVNKGLRSANIVKAEAAAAESSVGSIIQDSPLSKNKYLSTEIKAAELKGVVYDAAETTSAGTSRATINVKPIYDEPRLVNNLELAEAKKINLFEETAYIEQARTPLKPNAKTAPKNLFEGDGVKIYYETGLPATSDAAFFGSKTVKRIINSEEVITEPLKIKRFFDAEKGVFTETTERGVIKYEALVEPDKSTRAFWDDVVKQPDNKLYGQSLEYKGGLPDNTPKSLIKYFDPKDTVVIGITKDGVSKAVVIQRETGQLLAEIKRPSVIKSVKITAADKARGIVKATVKDDLFTSNKGGTGVSTVSVLAPLKTETATKAATATSTAQKTVTLTVSPQGYKLSGGETATKAATATSPLSYVTDGKIFTTSKQTSIGASKVKPSPLLVVPKVVSKSKTRSRTATFGLTDSAVATDTVISTSTDTVTSTKLATDTITDTATRSAAATTTATNTITSLRAAQATTQKTVLFPAIRTRINNKRRSAGFDVLVRRRGRFERINKKGLTYSEALDFGAYNVANTARATFTLVPSSTSGGKISKKEKGAFGFTSKNLFKKGGLFIEKKEKRIKKSSLGEKAEITAKGILASKNKRRFKIL